MPSVGQAPSAPRGTLAQQHRRPSRSVPARFGDADDARPLVVDVLARAARIAAIGLLLDLGATYLPLGLSPFGTPALRSSFVGYVLGLGGVLPTVVIAVTSLAVTSLSPYGNPALLLLHRRYRPNQTEAALRFLHGRTNPFHRALVLSFGLFLTLLVLAGSARLGVTQNHLPSLLWILFLSGVLSASALSLIFWLVALRRPSDLIEQTYQMAVDVLRESTRRSSLRSRPRRGVASPYTCRFEEQDEFKRCVYALTDVALRTLETRQRFSTRETIAALSRIHALGSRARFPPEWALLYPTAHSEPNLEQNAPQWWRKLIVESLESIELAAKQLRYASVARDAALTLARVAKATIGPPRGTGRKLPLPVASPAEAARDELVCRVIQAFENCVDECLDASEDLALEALLDSFEAVLKSRRESVRTWPRSDAALRNHLLGMCLRGATHDSVRDLRSILSFFDVIIEQAAAGSVERSSPKSIVLDLGAASLASRSYHAASVLLDWFSLEVAREQWLPEAIALRWPSPAPVAAEGMPRYVKDDYYRLFVLLAAARFLCLSGPYKSGRKAIEAVVRTLPQGERHARFVIERIDKITALDDKEVRDWHDKVKELL